MIEDRLKSKLEKLQEEMDLTYQQYKRHAMGYKHADQRLQKLRFKRESLLEALETEKKRVK